MIEKQDGLMEDDDSAISLSFQVSLSLGGSDVVLNICPHESTLQLYTLKGSTRYRKSSKAFEASVMFCIWSHI